MAGVDLGQDEVHCQNKQIDSEDKCQLCSCVLIKTATHCVHQNNVFCSEECFEKFQILCEANGKAQVHCQVEDTEDAAPHMFPSCDDARSFNLETKEKLEKVKQDLVDFIQHSRQSLEHLGSDFEKSMNNMYRLLDDIINLYRRTRDVSSVGKLKDDFKTLKAKIDSITLQNDELRQKNELLNETITNLRTELMDAHKKQEVEMTERNAMQDLKNKELEERIQHMSLMLNAVFDSKLSEETSERVTKPLTVPSPHLDRNDGKTIEKGKTSQSPKDSAYFSEVDAKLESSSISDQ